MGMRRVLALPLSCLALLLLPSSSQSQPGSPQDTFRQSIAELRKHPNDSALREKVLALGRQEPALDIPEEARRFVVRGQTLAQDAKSPSDYAAAAAEFRRAIDAAPWWADAYFNCGVALEAAERFAEARTMFAFYLKSGPPPPERRKVQDKIYALEARQERAAREARERLAQERLASPEGRWLSEEIAGGNFPESFREGLVYTLTNASGAWRLTYQGREIPVNVSGRRVSFRESGPSGWEHDYTLTDDGQELRGRCRSRQGSQDFDQSCALVRR